ncbi:hypothetical protein PanWU01x14_121310 [Parasponia andersonii]|uniref:Transmembrane protein n=1 Tax=Parasponia andersonii TaxID=3476 RepID=A0A2P5CV55_PARAD|nr:hypothetical protein PanWU01x14_121310 [Parasponia andersonii]
MIHISKRAEVVGTGQGLEKFQLLLYLVLVLLHLPLSTSTTTTSWTLTLTLTHLIIILHMPHISKLGPQRRRKPSGSERNPEISMTQNPNRRL